MVLQAPSLMPKTIGFVVAGGHSERMGRDKALLPWAGTTLLEHALARLRAVCGEVQILAGAEARYTGHGAVVQLDIVRDAGPLGGVHAGLLSLDVALGVFLGVDTPLVPSALLGALLAQAEGFDAVVPVVGGWPEPLCAVYRATCLDAVQRRLEAGDRKMTSFWPDVRVRAMEEDELAAFGDPEEMFQNLNTPEDYLRRQG
ncbi:MAG: molybdenum cofactor guanylyltransferase [Acidobacteria bacterium]|nr:MAG: molybdenum cofactor guanylyltransferase [Acidobacteriota bacterium]